jgi:uncharacterized membrane-anchored protein YjiN (DUF445 family)
MAMTELERRVALRRMKVLATGLLAAAAAVFGLTYLAHDGSAGWVGFVRAAAEAAMVGGLADWFAVTALFRHPLGLPIPHTALIPQRKDTIGESLGDFVNENFLSSDILVNRLREVDAVRRAGSWLAQPQHAERVTAELAVLLRAALLQSARAEVSGVLSRAAVTRLAALSYAALVGRLLSTLVDEDKHQPVVDIVVTSTRRWLTTHRAVVVRSLTKMTPNAIPWFIKDPAVERVYEKACDLAREVERDPHHELRSSVDQLIGDYATRLGEDPVVAADFDVLVRELLSQPATGTALQDLLERVLQVLVELAEETDGPVRTAVTARLVATGVQLRDDTVLTGRVQEQLERLVSHLVLTYGSEFTRLVSDTVQRWDPVDTTRRIELQVGRDLQFIRINGTVVGALAGLGIHVVALLL